MPKTPHLTPVPKGKPATVAQRREDRVMTETNGAGHFANKQSRALLFGMESDL